LAGSWNLFMEREKEQSDRIAFSTYLPSSLNVRKSVSRPLPLRSQNLGRDVVRTAQAIGKQPAQASNFRLVTEVTW
jgi:hypothetical protein